MLCDLMIEEWFDRATRPVQSPENAEVIAKAERGDASKEELLAARDEHNRLEKELRAVAAWLRQDRPRLEESSIARDRIPEFQGRLRASHKFFLTKAFADASLARLATSETVVIAKEWFHLIHDPMWFEWQCTEGEDLRMGALLYSVSISDEESAIICYVVSGTIHGTMKYFQINLCRLFPDSFRLEGDKFTMDIEDEQGMPFQTSGLASGLAMWAYDFVIRLNSPRITEFRPPEDMSRINKKRLKLGRLPLSTYQVVDLNKTIKAYLRQTDEESSGVRFHWRRGHFKARKTGLFWWNPHTAGRKVFGEIKKDYAA